VPFTVTVENHFKKTNYDQLAAYRTREEPLRSTDYSLEGASTIIANFETLQNIYKYTRRAGHTYAMFQVWLTHIQTHADRVVIVGFNKMHVRDLKSTERDVLRRLREEFIQRTKPNFFRRCLIKLGFAEREMYQELGELHIIEFNKVPDFVRSSKAIVVIDNGVYLNFHQRL
jgi:hypothetical protein